MGISADYFVFCDGDDGECPEQCDPQLDEDEAVEWAIRCGWLVTDDDHHYCPKCAPDVCAPPDTHLRSKPKKKKK